MFYLSSRDLYIYDISLSFLATILREKFENSISAAFNSWWTMIGKKVMKSTFEIESSSFLLVDLCLSSCFCCFCCFLCCLVLVMFSYMFDIYKIIFLLVSFRFVLFCFVFRFNQISIFFLFELLIKLFNNNTKK